MGYGPHNVRELIDKNIAQAKEIAALRADNVALKAEVEALQAKKNRPAAGTVGRGEKIEQP